MQTAREVSEGQLDITLCGSYAQRMRESVHWPDSLLVYTEKCKRETFFVIKIGEMTANSDIWASFL